MIGVASNLGPFLARPPTPPRESLTKLPNDIGYLNGASMTNTLLDTPDESPASSAENCKESSGQARKRVGFSGWTQYHRHSPVGSKNDDSDEQTKRLPPSRECNPRKSILKPYVDASLVKAKENLAFDQASLPGMLRSAASHLASDSRSAKIDAYTSLVGCLSAYEEVLDMQVLTEEGGEIIGAIRRDVDVKNEDGTPDTQLAAHALKLVTVLLCTKGTLILLSDEFCSFLFEQSIACLEDPDSPKMLVSHYMHLLEKQKFSPKILTIERATRLLLVLGIITTRVKGNRVVCHRLNIYQRLLSQARPLMVSRVGSWIDNLVSGMLSTIKEVRARAIAFGMEAGLHLGTIGSVSQECTNVFNRQSPEGTLVVEFLASRLTEMTKTKEDGLHVPQIWSVVLLFFRSRNQQIERWEHLKLWLGILQQCFNSNDAQIKFQANIAWNRFVFALDISMSTSSSMARMLKQPIVSQLERKSPEKNAKLAKQIARSSYCNLLYYALRPSATHAQLDHYWDLYVAELLPKAFSGSQTDIGYACNILANLFFNNSQPRIWDINKANATGPMKPDDLPVLDPKWLRSKTESVLEIFKKLFELGDWKGVENYSVILTWMNFMSALGNASSKEVKVSMGTMTAVAKIVNCLRLFLTSHAPNETGPDNLEKFNILLKDAIAKIGHIPFNEKRLLLTQSHGFEAAGETPSARGTSKFASLDSAATHLLDLLLEMRGDHDLGSRKIAIGTVLHLAIQNASSRRSRIRNLRNVARQICAENTSSLAEGSSLLWNSIAEEIIGALELPRTTEKHNDSPEHPGHEYRDIVKVLELGVHLRSGILIDAWARLFDSVCEALRKEVGNVGIILVVLGPIAEVVCDELRKQCDKLIIGCAVALLKSVYWPVNSKIIESAQIQLWGVQPMQQKSDPQESLKPSQRLTTTLLQSSYASIESTNEDALCSTISTATSLLKVLPHDNGRQFLKETQQGYAVWIEDATRAIRQHSSVFVEVERMYETVQMLIKSSPNFDNTLLVEFEVLFISCFRSRHKYILNRSVLMWNCTLGGANTLSYSEESQRVLSKLRHWTDIQLPNFPILGDSEAAYSPLRFDDSEDSGEDAVSRIQHDTPNKLLSTEQPSPRFSTPSKKFAAKSPHPINASAAPMHQQSARRDVKTTPTAKLRHNDSQIHFAAIESSPIADDSIVAQMFTDRQKEVRDRQEHEAVLFPDIRSSPRGAPVVTQYRLPSLALNSTEALNKLDVDETTGPSFPPDAMMSNFLGSSPTPSSSRKRSAEPYPDDGPPSSPPMISSHLQLQRTVLSPEHAQGAHGNEKRLSDRNDANVITEVLSPTLPPMKVPSDQSGSAASYPVDENSSPRLSHNTIENNLLSDMDVYVDAPTDRNKDMPSELLDVGAAPEQSRSQESSFAATEDDQVTAQIMGEIAKAASQRSSPTRVMYQAEEVVKKRKSVLADGPRKRRKDDVLAPSSVDMVAVCVPIGISPSMRTPHDMKPFGRVEQSVPSQSPGPVPKTVGNTLSADTSFGNPPDDRDLALKTPAVSWPRVRVKPEACAGRRSGRITRTSSRLSDVSMNSPNCSDVTPASQRLGDESPLGWTHGPRGSRWAYVPVTGPDNARTLVGQSPEVTTIVDREVSSPERDEVEHIVSSMYNTAQPAETGSEVPTVQGILQGLQKMLNSIPQVSLRPEEERQMVSLLFESVHRVHEAGRRHTT